MKIQQHQKIILASQSPRRKEMLEMCGIQIQIMPSDIAEIGYGGNPELLPLRIATQKLKAVVARLGDDWKGTVIAADTVVALDRKTFGKPENDTEAKSMLLALSGRTHEVFTAFIVQNEKGSIEKTIKTTVTMRPISQSMLDWYISTKEPFDKAGGYGIQGAAGIFIDSIQGSFSNVVGLPIAEVIDALMELKAISYS